MFCVFEWNAAHTLFNKERKKNPFIWVYGGTAHEQLKILIGPLQILTIFDFIIINFKHEYNCPPAETPASCILAAGPLSDSRADLGPEVPPCDYQISSRRSEGPTLALERP